MNPFKEAVMRDTDRGAKRAALLLMAFLAGALGSLSTSETAGAQQARFEIAPYVGGFFTEDLDVQDLENAPIYGARVGVRLTDGLWIEGQVGYSPLESSVVLPGFGTQSFDLNVLLYEAGLAYTVPLPGPIKPFLGAAAGAVRFDPDFEFGGTELDTETSLVASAGAGLRLELGVVSLRADLRDHFIMDPLEEARELLQQEVKDETIQAIEASAGISFFF
jgi:hypothetical protein